MSQQIIDTGNVAGDGSGDTLFVAFTKTNQNFTELYSTVENQGLTYVNVAIGTTSGNGTGATFNVTRYVNEYSVQLNTNGTGFAANDTITLWGNAVGGNSSLNNVSLTVSTLANATVGNLSTFSVAGTPVQPVLSVAGRTGNVILTVNDVLGAVSPADLQSNIANAKVVVSGWITANVNNISSLTNVSINNSTIVGGSIANATLSNVSGQFSTLNVSGLATVSQLSVNSNAIFGGNILPAAGRGILFNDGTFQSTAATSTNLVPINANVTAANAAITALQSNAATQATAIAALQSADFATNSALAATNANVSTLQSNAATQAGQITSLQTALSGYATVSAVTAANARVTAANIEIDALRANVTAANATIAAIGSSFATNASVASANASVTAANVEIGKLRANITAANAAIAALQAADFATNSSVTAANSAIAALQSNASTQADQIAYANASISTLTTNAATQATTLNSISANVSTLTSNAATQATAIGALESNAATQAGQIAALESNAATQAVAINSLTSNSASQESRISTLTANAAGQTNEIAALRANITAANAEISTLQTASANYLTSANLSAYATVTQLSTNVATLNANDVQQGTLITALQANITAANAAIATKANLSGAAFTGNISAPNVAISGQLDVTGNITVNSIDAVNVVNAATGDFNQVNGLLMTGTQTNITRVGTLVNLTVTGNTVSGNVVATQGTFTSVQGTLLTGNQPNITGVGTLGNLAVSGTVTAANVVGTVVVAGRAEVGSGNIVADSVTVTNLSAANVLIQDGNIDGVIIGTTNPERGRFSELIVPPGFGNTYVNNMSANAISAVWVLANSGVSASTLEGTIITNAQPFIESVGTLDDLTVQGNIAAQSNVTVQGNLTAGNVIGTNAVFNQLTGTLITAAQPNVTSVGTLNSLAVAGNVTAGNVSASNVTGTLLTAAQPNITSVGTLTTLDVAGDIVAGQDLTVTGNLYVMGNTTSVDTQQLIITDANITLGNGLPNAASANLGGIYLDGANASIYYLYTYDSWVLNKGVYADNFETDGYVRAANLKLDNGVGGIGGYVTAGNALLSNVQLSTVSGTQATFVDISGNLTAVFANATNVNATNITGTLLTAAQTNITTVGTLAALSVTGNISNATGNVNTGNVHVTNNLVVVDGNIEAVEGFLLGPIGTAEQPYITEVGTLDFLDVNTTITANGNITAGNVSATTAVFAEVVGALLTNAQPNITSVGNLTNLDVAGNVTASDLFGTLQTVAQPNITTVGNLINLEVAGNITVVGNIDVDSVNAINLIGTLTGNVSGYSGSFNEVSGTLQTAAQPNITSVGTLTNLSVTGNVTADVITANSFVGDLTGNASAVDIVNTNGLTTVFYPTFVEQRVDGQTLRADIDLSYRSDTNTLTVGALSTSGNVNAGNVLATTGSFTNIVGTLLTALQPNITSVGSLTSLDVVGNATTGNVSGTTGSFTNVVGTLLTASQTNITSVGNLTNLDVAGNISAVGNITGATVTANNLIGTLAGNASGFSINYTEITGTLQTAAQPNITSVGNLISLDVVGNVTTGNISGTTSNFNNIVGTLLTNSQPNITSVGTLGNLDVSGTVTANSFVGNFTISTLSANIVAGLANITVANIATLTGNLALLNILLTQYFNSNVAEINQLKVSTYAEFINPATLAVSGTINNLGNANLANVEVTGNLIGNSLTTSYANVTTSASIANLTVTGSTNLIGNSTVGNISGTQATFTSFDGLLLTNAQPNVNSLGNLIALNVDNDLSVGGNIVLTGSFDASQGNVTLGAVAELNVTGNASIQNTFTANSTSLFVANAEFVSNIDLRGNLNFVNQAILKTNAANVYVFSDTTVGNLYLGQNAENIWVGPTENTGLTRIGSLDANIVAVDTIAILGDTGFEANVAANIYAPALTSFAPMVINQVAFDSTGNIATNSGNVTANANVQYQFLSVPVASTGLYTLPSEILGTPTGNNYVTLVTEAIASNVFDLANSSIIGGNAMVFSANVFYLPGGIPRANITLPENSAGLSTVIIDPPTKVRDTGDSLAIDQGALVVDGGMGVAKNLFVGGNISVQDNSTFAANITAGNITIVNKLELLSNIGLSLPNLDGTPIGATTPAEATFTEINVTKTKSNVRPLSIQISNGRRLDPRVSYTRSGSAWYVNSAGNLVSVGTDVPTIHFDANGVCQGLLIEPAATNLARGSNSFSNVTLYTSYGLNSGPGNAFVANSTTISAPTGSLHAVELYEDGTNGYHGFEYAIGPTALTTSQVYTTSLFAKANTRSRISVSILGENDGPVFDLGTGTIVTTGAANYTGADIQRIKTDDQGEHWYRVFVTTTKSNVSVAADKVLVFLANATSDVTFVGNTGSGGAVVWGLQLENNSFGTGYIETPATATASRLAATVSVTQANTAWAGNTVGMSVFVEAQLNHTLTTAIGSDQRYGLLSFQGSATERASVYVEDDLTGRHIDYVVYQSSNLQVNGSNLTVAVGNVQSTPINTGISLRSNDFSFVVNGGAVQTDSNALPNALFTVPVWSNMFIGSGAGLNAWNGTVKSIQIYPRKIVDEALQAATRKE